MLSYKNRLLMSPGTTVWHYTSLNAVSAMLRGQKIRLTRLDKFRDPFEGSVPKKQIDDQILLFSSAQATNMVYAAVATHYPGMSLPPRKTRNPWQQMTLRRRAKTRSAHAICWASGEESEAMWKLYCWDRRRKGQGLALRSTLAKLEASVAHDADVCVSPVRYRHYHEGPAFNDELDPLLYKRLGFDYEREVRVLKYDNSHYLALASHLTDDVGAKPPRELPQRRYMQWSLAGTVDAIVVSPYASLSYEAAARTAIQSLDPSVAVELSVLSELRYQANF
jgi:hypothetical protein